MSQPTILYDDEYCHVVNNESGLIEMVEGPQRFILPPNKSLKGGKMKKITLKEGQYVVVKNYYDPITKQNSFGNKVIRKGPVTFSKFPGEEFGMIQNAQILNKNQAAKILTLQDNEKFKAGDLRLIKGPTSFIPSKFERIEAIIDAITISENEAIYIQNKDNGKLKMINGPESYICAVNEQLFSKSLSRDESKALGLSYSSSSKAFQIQVQKNECICVIDYSTNQEKYIIGPEGYLLKPNEGIKCINSSSGVPKKENQLTVGILRMGPDFMEDAFQIRTKDNAVLELVLSYKWKFLFNQKEEEKLFAGDFIGYSCQSLRSRIREESSNHDFEDFNKNASEILRKKLFKSYECEITVNGKQEKVKENGRLFKEFNFLVFELDVKKITPVDREIADLLEESIKSSMKIICKKKNDEAEFQSEVERIANETETEKLKKNLIDIKNQNYTKEKIDKAKIEGGAQLEKAKAESQAENLIEQARIDLEVNNMREKIKLLKGKAGDKYVQYVKALNFSKNVKNATLVPVNTKTLFLPQGNSSFPYEEEEE